MKMIEIILIKNGRLKIKIIIIKIIKIIKIVITMNIIKKIITHCKKQMNKPFLINILNKKIREMKKIIIMKKKREKIITNREKIMNKNQARSISRIKILIKINCQSKTKINSIYNNIK